MTGNSTSVIGPYGEPLTLATLPPTETKRWYPRLKAQLVAAVNGGLLSVDDVCKEYRIDFEEFASWQRGLERLGMRGLFITRAQKNRDYYERFQKY